MHLFDGSIKLGASGYVQLGLSSAGQGAYGTSALLFDVPGERGSGGWARRAVDWAAHFACAMHRAGVKGVRLDNFANTIASIRLTAHIHSVEEAA